jgi:hypothetical protein
MTAISEISILDCRNVFLNLGNSVVERIDLPLPLLPWC